MLPRNPAASPSIGRTSHKLNSNAKAVPTMREIKTQWRSIFPGKNIAHINGTNIDAVRKPIAAEVKVRTVSPKRPVLKKQPTASRETIQKRVKRRAVLELLR